MTVTTKKIKKNAIANNWWFAVPMLILEGLLVYFVISPIMKQIDIPATLVYTKELSFWYLLESWIANGLLIVLLGLLSWRLAYEHQRYHYLQEAHNLSAKAQRRFIGSQRSTFIGLIITTVFGYVLVQWIIKRYLIFNQAFGDYIKWVYELGFVALILLITMIFSSLALRRLDRKIRRCPKLQYPLKR